MHDRPAENDCVIEVTPAMIDAGEDVLIGTLGEGVTCHWRPRDLAAEERYHAMLESTAVAA